MPAPRKPERTVTGVGVMSAALSDGAAKARILTIAEKLFVTHGFQVGVLESGVLHVHVIVRLADHEAGGIAKIFAEFCEVVEHASDPG
ncbi:hypothetical protein GCM10027046_15480 [Uliginosibacterium flavum]